MPSALRHRLYADLIERPKDSFPALDGMRGFASVIVLVYHCSVFSGAFKQLESVRVLANGFWSGIDIFFVLSGFLIGRILMANLSTTGTLRYRRFMLRRLFRIFPAYYLVLTAALFGVAPLVGRGWAFPLLFGSSDYDHLRSIAWTNYLYVNNYVNPGNEPGLMSWGWSLCVEEHFYLLLPPFLWAVFRLRSESARAALIAGAALLPLAGRALQFARDPDIRIIDGFYYYSHNRFDEILVGVGIAYLFVAHRARLEGWVRRTGPALGVAGLLSWAAVWTLGGLQKHGAFAVVGQFFVMALGSGLLVVHGLFRQDALTRFFAHPAWYPLSRISYGTYLVHPFVLFALLSVYFGAESGPPGGPAFLVLTAGTFVLASLLAAAMFVVWERPFLDWGVRLAGRETRG